MKNRRVLLTAVIITLTSILLLKSFDAAISDSLHQSSTPDGFSLIIAKTGVRVYEKQYTNGSPDYVQVVNLLQGGSVNLLHGTIAEPGENAGPFGGPNPTFWRQTLQSTWDNISAIDDNVVCITNGAFFADKHADGTPIDPTNLSYPLKKNTEIVTEGYGAYDIYNKLILEIWSDKLDIKTLSPYNNYAALASSSAPNIIAGLHKDDNKGKFSLIPRTFVGIDDTDNDGKYETILIFNSKISTQADAVEVLEDFGADKVMMLDGGGSTQLICEGQPLVESSRTIPQTLAISSGLDTTGTVDVTLIIDSSGSMGGNDPQKKRLEAAKAYLAASLEGDFIGVVDFDSSVRLASPLRRIPDAYNILSDAIDTIDSSGGTNIGIGIQKGCDILKTSISLNSTKGAILLTDGQGSFSGQDQCFKSEGWPIYTFGFGSANDALLQQIASNTGGEFKRLPTSNFVCEFQRVRALIAGTTPEACDNFLIQFLEWVFRTIQVPFGQAQMTVSTSWLGSDVEMSLVSPSGREINRGTNASDIIHELGSNYEIYTILRPESGAWTVQFYGADIPPEGEEVVFGFSTIPASNQPPILDVPGNQSVQYSDPLSFEITATDSDDPGDSLTFSAISLPSDVIITNNGDGTATVSGIVTASPGTYNAEISVTDPGGLSDTAVVPIVITQENARATYTGPMLVSTGCEDCSTAVIPLRATIQDITAILGDPGYDDYPGDITNANVNFVNRDGGNAVLCTASIVLFDPTDLTTASASCDWTADIGNSSGENYTVGIVVDGYYTRNSTEDDTLVVVSKPTTNFITGGGFILNQNPSGAYAGNPGLKTNFGLNLKFNKKLTNVQGKVTIIVRKDGHVYQIKTNVLSSLVVVPYNANDPNTGKAELVGKANLTDVTDPLNPVSVEGNATLQITMKDNGEPGSTDEIAITLWSNNGSLLFSSNWNGVMTMQQVLDGGNLQVH